MDYYTGEIRAFCGKYAPIDWLFCDGSEVPIDRFSQALYSIIKDNFKGPQTPAGRFKLPDLRGRVPIGMGTGSGLSAYGIGQVGGDFYKLNDVPSHSHQLSGTTDSVATANPTGNIPAALGAREPNFRAGDPDAALNTNTVGQAGNANPAPVNNMQPFLPLNFIICYNGTGG